MMMYLLSDDENYINPDGLYAFSDIEIHDDVDNYYGNFGFKNSGGEVVIPAQFLYASQFSNGYAVVCTKWKQPKNCLPSCIEFNYIDKTGKIVFESGFANAYDFNIYGVAAVWKTFKSEKMYLIDKNGKEIDGSQFTVIGICNRPEDRFYEFQTERGDETFYWDAPLGLYDTKNREIVFPAKYSDIEIINDNMFSVLEYSGKNEFDTQKIYIDRKGNPLFSQQCGKGFCTVSIPDEDGTSVVSLASYKLLPDSATRWISINGKKYEMIQSYGVIDRQGNYIIDPIYKNINRIDGGFECTPFDSTSDKTIISL